MFKKFASVALAASMVLGGAAITASAAEAEDAVAADDSSVVAAADDSSVGADESSSVGSGKTISADVKSFKWGDTVKKVFCHIFACSGDGKTYTGWQTKGEKCDYDPSTGIATYDLQTGIDKGADGLSTIDGSNKWAVMFSSDIGQETYTLLFNSSCFGDTVVATGEQMENNEDSEKTSLGIKYKNSNLTAPKCITSTGKVQGTSFAEGTSNDTLLGDYLYKFVNDDKKFTVDNIKSVISTLGSVNATAVAAYVANKAETDVKNGVIESGVAEEINKKVTDILAAATGTDKKELEKAAEDGKKAADEGKSANEAASAEEKADGNGGSSSNGGSSNGGSSTKSGSVSSGQETTIFFVLGGLMIAAAGVMFLARKKRQF